MKKKAFDKIVLIYNPKSTNDAMAKAKDFKAALKKAGYTSTLAPTERKLHAIELAKTFTKKYTRPLIISVSGDGGYNEVINGVMQACETDATCRPVVAVIGAGNANDHKRLTRGETPLIQLVKKGKTKPLDLIRLQAKNLDRYAHSYIGLGITPEVAIELNKHQLNFFEEIKIIFRSFRNFTPSEILVDGKKRRLGSLLFANIHGMAKLLKLSENENVNDGKFEIIRLAYDGTGRLLLDLALMAIHVRPAPKASKYRFRTIQRTAVQFDGEVEHIPAHSEVLVESMQGIVDSLY